ncbi:uncharacterized protein LOC110452569 isoform X2 [Mizuhopecten yessoensis]|nr:uncharacterized protein LOC110452569 isoform X2 [Mizuhopecten yessoensis]
MDGIIEYKGRLEVYENGRWGTVCDNGWKQHKENVIVACRQLGFATGNYTSRRVYNRRDKKFLVDNLICNGQERRLGACQFDVPRYKNCAGRDDSEINLWCDRPPSPVLPTKDDIRLMNGKDAFEGRVEIFRGNNWLSICQNGWGTNEARVVCKQLGFNGGITKFNAFYGQGYGMPWRVKLTCDSTKDKLIDCEVLAAICIQSYTAGVVCEAPVPFGSLCKPEERCEGNSVCVMSQRRQLCQCLDETTMFWDSALSTCKMKSGYNASCRPGIPDNCASTLVCNTYGNTSKCLCLHDMFWDDRQTKCKLKSGYNEPCRPGIPDNCASTLVCNTYGNASKCLCLHDMFWDDRQTKCEQKSGYDEPCRPGIPDNCASTLVCNTYGDPSKCLCLHDMFWDDRQTKCEQKSLYNETCYAYMTDSCGSNLVCNQQFNNSICRCYDEGRMFWNPVTSACQTKKPYNDMCATSRECQSNLGCRLETDSNRCLWAEQGFTLWHVGAKSCFSVNKLQADFIQLELEYNQAQTHCANEVNGSFATWNDFQMVFENCRDNIEDIWIQTMSEMPNKNDTLCQLARMGDRYYNISCYERLNFVCIHERDNTDNIPCKDFPLGTLSPEHLTPSRTALVLTIVIALLVIGAAVTVFIFKRKRKKYFKTWNSNGLSAGDGLQVFLNNTYDTNAPFIENPYMEVSAANEPAYANIATKAETLEHRQVKTNRDNVNHYTEVLSSKSTGYIDMEGRLPFPSTNVTGDGYTRCNPSASNAATRDDYSLCSGSEMTPGIYNTFSDMNKLSTDHETENPYDHIQPTTEDGYGVLNGSKELIANETDDDISGHRNSSECPL